MTPTISGADAVVAWFGEWPTFHDAEVLTLRIDCELKRSFLRVRVFTRSNRTDADGHFLRERDALVVFEFTGIRSMDLHGEDADIQNDRRLRIDEMDNGYRIPLWPSYGLAGEIIVTALNVRIESTS